MDNTYTSRLINIAGLVKTKVKSLVAFFVLFLLLGTSTYAQQNRTVSPAGNKGSISINAGQDGKGLLTKVDSYDNGIDDMLKKYDKQIYFTQNKGQWPSGVLYKADFTYGQAVATSNGMLVSSFDPASVGARSKWVHEQEEAQHDGKVFNKPMPNLKGHAWLMNFVGSSPAMTMSNKDGHNDVSNYFIGNASATNVQSFNEVWYNNVYKNIDVRYYPSAQGTLEYDIIAKPGSDPTKITINFDGIDKLELTREGHLVLNTSVGAMDLPEPYAYQMVNGKEVKVEAVYTLNDKNQLTFALGKYDTSKPLIIDPIALRWATWITNNSAADNHGHGIWVDGLGNIYVVARFSGSGLITTPGAFDTSNNGGLDLNIGKYTEPTSVGGTGTRIWQTYVGGSSDENPYVCEMGPDGNLYIAGYTTSTDFPLSGGTGFSGSGLDGRSQSGDNCFVVKINPAGTGIKSAVVGGNGTDDIFDLRITAAGDIVIGGATTSTNLLTRYSGSGASNTNNGGNDFWMFRINQDLTSIGWMRNYGGSGADQINIINIKSSNNDIYAGGSTASTGLTLVSPRQGTKAGGTVGYLQRMNSSGTIQWSSYFNSSGSNNTSILCMEMNADQTAFYFGGMTQGLASTNISSSGVYDNSQNGSRDFYVARMALDQTFAYSTYVGSTADEDNMMGLNVDANNDVYIFGYTYATGTLFPTTGNPLQSSMAGGSRDKVFFKLETDLSALLYSTYYGGASDDSDPVGQRGIKFSNCRIYTIVTAESNNIPLTQGAITTGKASATTIYEPALIVWANPPDLNNNTIGPNQNICSGSTPALLDGQTPSYVLPTIIRNGTTSAHPALTSGISYQWQRSVDNSTWTNIPGATGEDLTPAQMGALTQSTYFRRVFNGDACVVSAQTNVKIGVFAISAAGSSSICFGSSAGSITVTPTDGTPNYQYQINGGAFQSSNVFSGLPAGTYTITAKDANNCIATTVATITEGSEIVGTITTTNASCQAVCNGTATVSGVIGGTGPYTYTWLSGGTGATKTGLCAGTNYVVITDAAGCKDTIDFSINTNPPTQISITVNNVYCAGDNSGSATVNILSGTGPYTYLWSNGQTTQTATGLTVGTYTVTVTDANGCSVSSNAIVQEYSNLVALVSTTEANGGNNGTASVSVFGGTSPYTYLWSNGATTPSISGLATGNYSVTVTDAAGNTVTQIFSITTINDIAAGSFIINMGVTPQTFANGLKPYGLIYDLTRNQNVPVKWVIKTSKAKDAADFTINGTDFKSGAFVIEAKYRTPAVNAVISNWVSQGVVGITTTAAVTLPVYKTITTFSNVVVDQQNENLVLPYFANAGLPTSMYTVGLPSSLDGCDDAYIMPHADPTWATHSNLLTFNTTNKGYIWGGCHAPSVLEGIFNPSNSSQRMNFLSSTGLQCYNGNGCGSLITESHGNPTTPYTYQAAYNSDPIMQFMGDLTPSTENGSERWYIPLTTSQWRPTSSPAITTADGASPRQGVKLVYGPGFGNANNGMVMYEAGHTSDGRGTVASQVAFQRAFFNFLLNAGIQKGLNITANIPQTFVSGVGQTASVTVTGGTAPYTYAWSTACGATIANPTAASTSITFPSLAPQTQCFVTCVVTDACGRRNFVSVAIASQTMPPAPFTITLAGQTNNTCFGACTGAINITPSGATPPYTYTWSNGATTQDLTGLCNGTYTVIVRDANNCTKTATYTITSPTAVSATIGSQTNVLCFGQSTGSVTVNATGGTSPYTYKIGSGSYGSSNTFSGLAAGTYVVTVRDANNCTTTVNVTITQPSSAVSVSISSTTNASCGGSNGALTAVGAGGITPYQYSLNGGTYQSSGTFSGLTGGSYTVTVRDANNCTGTVNATINNNAGPTATIGSQVNVLCFGGATGSVTVSQSGGTSPYQYQLGSGSFQTNATFGGLLAGTYTFTVRDANNCVSSVTTTITQPASAVSGSITSQTNVACNGGNGSVTVAGAGGVAPYQYSFNGGAYQSSGTFSNLAAGSYTVTVRDANLCTATVPVTITQPSNLSVSLVGSPTNVLCFGNSTGSFTVAGSGGTTPYQYSNNGGAYQSSGSFTGLAAGSYVVTVKDNNNCTSTVTVTISQPSNPLSGSITAQTNVLCFGNSTGSVTIAGSGGTAPYQYSNNGGTYQSSGTFGSLAAGSYTVTVLDANGCTTPVAVTINQPAGPLVASSSNQVNVLCFGQSTGSVQINGIGGTAPYEFRIGSNAYGTSNAFTGLAAGTYTFTVRDANGCTATTNVTITQPGSAVDAANGPQTNVLCFGNTTGSATVVGNGGVSPYTFNINGGAYGSSATFNGLGAGTYTLGVRDANGCTDFVSVTITQPAAALNASANVTNASCAGSTNGSVIITATGGTASYQYQLGSGSFQSGNSFSGLSAGSYTVTVRDNNNCTYVVNFNVSELSSTVSGSISSQTNVLCFGASTGAVTVAGSGGVTPYQYSINGGTFQGSGSFTGLAAGNYFVTVKDANGCLGTVNVTITQPGAPVSGNITNQVNVLCNGAFTGAITITGNGGVGPYQYSLNGGTYQASGIFTGLAAGSYVVTVKDNNNCTGTVNVTITQPSTPVAGSIVSQTNVLCFGQATGSVTVSGSGGVGPYQFNINGGSFSASNTFSNLAAGSYTVLVRDANGCLFTLPVTITQPGSPVSGSIVAQTNASCLGAAGSVTVAGSGGTGSYQYSLNGGAFQALGLFTGLNAGTYTVTVRDANGCTFNVPVNITQPADAVTGSIIAQTNVSCFGGNNGAVTVAGAGGVAPYTYSFEGGAFSSTNSFAGLTAGSYDVTVKDNNGCLFVVNVNITQPSAPLSVSITSQTNVSCFGGSNGSVTVIGAGGTPAYVYRIGLGAYQSSGTFNNLAAGTYTITVRDSKLCTSTVTVVITQPSTPVSGTSDDVVPVACYGDASGSFVVIGAGGVAPYTYSFNGGAFNSSNSYVGLVAGTYSVVVRDANGCTSPAVVVTITQPNGALSANIGNQTNILCYGAATGSFSINANGGTAPYQYSLNGGAYNASNTFANLTAGIYLVVVRDANGCNSSPVVVTLTQPNAPLSGSITNSTNVLCYGNATGAATVSAIGGTPGYTYLWNTVPAQTGPTATGLVAGTYNVTVTDANGCFVVRSVTITQPNAPLSASITNSVNVCPTFATGSATVTASGGTPNYLYSWNTVPAQNSATATGLAAGTYTVTVTDANGCTTTATVTISNNPKPQAGGDQSICQKVSAVVPAGQGEIWSSAPGNPAPAVINQAGAISGMNTGGIYLFILTNQFGCADTVAVTTTANCPLIANPDNAVTNEDTPVNINVPGNDVDPDGNINNGSVTIVDQPDNGTVTINPVTGVITYTPNANYNGPDSFIYNICDTGMPVYCDTALVTINVVPVNDPPVANEDPGTTPEDTPITIYVPGNDTDPEDGLDSTSVTIVDPPNHGTVVVDTTTGNITYTPDPNYNGPDTLIYSICDQGMPVLCDTALVIINVTPVNDPPVANQDVTSTPEDVPVAINVPVNDTDVDGNLDVTTVTIVDQPNNGTATVYPVTGIITYTPNNNFNGVDTLIYNICDTGMPVYCDTALVVIFVGPVNDPPVANIDHATTPEDVPVSILVPGNDTDNDGNLDPTSVTIVDQPNNGTVTVDPVTGAVTYTPNANFNGVDSLIYQICDTGMPVLCDTAYVIINVDPSNDPPIANQDNSSTNEDTPVTIQVPGNDTDVDGNLDPTTVTIVDQPNNGTVTVDPITGAIVYTPNANFNGVDTLIYNICDTGMPVMCDTALVIINVNPVNDPPIANQDNATTPEDTNVDINVPGNDTDVDGNLDPTSVTIVDQPSNGTVTIDPVTGVITYDPNPNFNGVDTLIYQICDTGMPVLCDTALVIINVNPVNDPPVANQDDATTPEDTPVTINVPGNDTDNDGNLDPTSVTIVDQPNNGTVTVDPVTGEVIYTPNPNFNGVDTLIYQICDTGMPVLCDTALVIINVTPVNDPPIANQDNATTPEDTPVTINLPGNDTDVDGNLDPTSVTIVDQPNNGTVTVDPVTGEIIYTPNPNFNGVDTLIYNICDTGLPVLCDTALVIINVNTVNDPPIANTDYANTGEDMPVTIDLPANDTDVDGNLDTTSVTIVTPPVNGTVVINPDGSIIYTPNPNFWGADSLIYQICDTGMPVLCDTAWVYINVETNNDELIAILDTASTPEDTPVTIQVPDNDIDVDNNIDYSSVTIILPPANGAVSGIDPVTGFITYTPNLNFNGTDSLIYQICDLGSPVYCDTAWVYINVGPVNDPPVAVTDTASTLEDTPININIDFNDYDVDGNLDTNSVVIVTPPLFGNAIYDPTLGEIIYTPNANFFGTDSLLYNICDSLGLCDTAWVFITIQSVPDLVLDPSIFPSGNNISCFGANDGSIDLTIDLGVPPYTITWTGPNGFSANTEDISGLAPGTYTVVVVDANGSTATGSITLTEPPLLQSSTVVVSYSGGYNVSCGGASPSCDGAIDLSVSGGSPAYSYSWTGPGGFVAVTQDIANLCIGTYTVVVTDANGCTTTQTVTLTAPPALEVGGVALEYNGGNNVSCANACDGSIDLVINGGVAPFVITWTGPNGFASSSEDITGLCAGVYNVTVVDANNCSTTTTITLLAPQPLTSNAVAGVVAGGFNITCNGACDGTINATISGGTAPYSYSWVGPNGFVAVTEDLSGLCAGTYVLTITDANGCTSTSTVTLTQPEVLSATAIAAVTDGGTNISCNGTCDGSIDMTITGGTAPYTVSWTGPNGFVSSLVDINALCVGTYVATVIDANGCTASVTMVLTGPTPLVSTGVASSYTGGYNISCNGGNNGSIDVTTTGGSGSYTFNWSGPGGFSANTEDIANLYAGTYTLIVSDVNGCDDTLTFIMTEPEPISLVAVNAPSFCGLSNGTIDLTVNGGSGFYNYVWTDGNTGLVIGNSEDLFNITGGVYIVAVTDTNGCTMMDTVIVGDKPPVVITGTTTPTNCNGACNGAINVTLVGDGPYIINWTGPNNFSSTDEDLVALCAGTYIITVQDGNSCTVVDTFVITAPNAINITVVANNAATCSASNGSIDISVEGGSGTYSYSWTGPNGFTSTSQDLTGLAEGCYVVTVTDAGGCSSTQTICVGSVSNLVLNTTPVNVSCNGLNNGSACAEVTGSTPPVSFLWSNGDTTQCTDSLAPGTYVVIVTDANGCTGSDTIVITEPDAIIVAADIPVYPNGYNVSGPNAEDGSIDLTVTGGTVPYTYDWNLPAPNDILEDQVSLPADTYVVVITDANGCTITEEYILTEPPLIELPTGFSPDNGDGLNDFYVIHGIDGLIDNKFTVFNRWGQVIFEKEGYQNDWAGTNFQGRLMPDGTYFILFTVNVPNQGNLTFKATVELRHNLGK